MANSHNFTAANNDTMLNHTESGKEDVKTLAASYMMYKIGKSVEIFISDIRY